MRKPFQGIWNIVRFNWHFYVLAGVFIILILFLNNYLTESFRIYGNIICISVLGTTFISLFVSFYVYDLSGLYKLNWLSEIKIPAKSRIVNINAGLDETSHLLKEKYKNSELLVFDFYDPLKHTEISIKRARKAYPPFPDTKQINTCRLPIENDTTNNIFVLLAAHEIRNDEERIIFFKELSRVLKDSGNVIVTEHLRDIPNFLAYNIGFFHFLSRTSWDNTFRNADLKISKKINITPFITVFILTKNLQ